jgi:sorbitol-specific phosphotransferase system component IIBC
MSTVPLQLKNFNDKVRVMTQSHSKILTMTQQEAHALHTEIYDLLATIAELVKSRENNNTIAQISMDGGGFK